MAVVAAVIFDPWPFTSTTINLNVRIVGSLDASGVEVPLRHPLHYGDHDFLCSTDNQRYPFCEDDGMAVPHAMIVDTQQGDVIDFSGQWPFLDLSVQLANVGVVHGSGRVDATPATRYLVAIDWPHLIRWNTTLHGASWLIASPSGLDALRHRLTRPNATFADMERP